MTLSCCAGSRRKYWIVACVPRKERASSGSVDKSPLRPCSPSSSRARRCWPWLPYLLGVNGDAAADLRARACGGGPQGSEFDVKSLLQQKTLAQLQGNSIRRRQQRQDAAGVYLKQTHDSGGSSSSSSSGGGGTTHPNERAQQCRVDHRVQNSNQLPSSCLHVGHLLPVIQSWQIIVNDGSTAMARARHVTNHFSPRERTSCTTA